MHKYSFQAVFTLILFIMAGYSRAQDWVERSPMVSPPARSGHAMAYDAARKQVVLFGGGFDDTWVWDGATWTEKHPATKPPARSNHSMAYDSVHQMVLLFGPEEMGKELWGWNGEDWTIVSVAPFPHDFGGYYDWILYSGATIAFDSARGELIVHRSSPYCGYGFTHCSDTWTWNGTWREISNTNLAGRPYAPMTFDPRSGNTILFGGGGSGGNWTYLNDTWLWNGSAWQQQPQSALWPAPRIAEAMTCDTKRGTPILFGGSPGVNIFSPLYPSNDAWTWDGTTWSPLITPHSPPATMGGALAYDADRDEIILFGGSGYSGWTGTWALTNTPLPPCTFALSSASDRMPAEGGSRAVTVTASAPSCTWTATSSAPWISINPVGTRQGSGTFTYTVEPNSSVTRNGTITVADQTLTITQVGPLIVLLTVTDPDKSMHLLTEARVALLDTAGTIVNVTVTDRAGHAVFPPSLAGTYRLRVFLQHQRPKDTTIFEVLHNGHEIELETDPFVVGADAGTQQNIDISSGAHLTDSSVAADRIVSLGMIYVHTKELIDFYRDKLQVTPQLTSPLKVDAYFSGSMTSGAAYQPDGLFGGHRIRIDVQTSGFASLDRPMNREWHETSHELMDQTIGIPWLSLSDKNHDGYANSSTTDSWTEGWAEFFPLVLWKNMGLPSPELYRMNGAGGGLGALSMEVNRKTWDYEEFAVCSLLWDLIDPIDDVDDDYIEMSLADLWQIIGTQSHHDMKDVYDALTNANIGQSDSVGDGINDLDRLFIVHGFFVDQQPDYVHESTEEVGRAAYGPDHLNRRNAIIIPGANIKFAVLDGDGKSVTDGVLVTEHSFPLGGARAFRFEYSLKELMQRGGMLYLVPLRPPDYERVVIYGRLPNGEETGKIAIPNEQYWNAVQQSTGNFALRASLYVGQQNSTATLALAYVSPNELNLGSKNAWITVRIEPPADIDIRLLDPSTVRITAIGDTVLPLPIPAIADDQLGFVKNIEITDLNQNGLVEGMVRFSRDAVRPYLALGRVMVTISGQLRDQKAFIAEATATVSK